MTVRTGRLERLGVMAVLALFLAGCATPYTHLAWGVRHAPLHRSSHQVAYRTRNTRIPTPRPRPAWYEDNRAPAWSRPDQPAWQDQDSGDGWQSSDTHFSWPVNGRILSGFGSYASGERNDGINIGTPYGEPIRAAADGIVTYAGNDLRSYGNLALIKHDGNYVTAYAHAERFIVSRGDHVAKGQVIGYAGSTGDVASPQLHFEIRRGVQPIDPQPLLGPLQVASR
ncbi:MAG: M23 family metallopeptidase [Alphaproteobacteria bacterium]|nr:M23 family metallopeptidase [Alphaproteobacteria bacterium]